METKPLPGLALYPYVEGGTFIETQFVKNALKPKDSWQYLKSPCRLFSQANNTARSTTAPGNFHCPKM